MNRRRVTTRTESGAHPRRREPQQGPGFEDETLDGFIVPDEEVEDYFEDGDDDESDVEAVPRTLQTSRY